MTRHESFDDFNSSAYAEQVMERKPFQFREEPSSKDATLKWLKDNFDQAERLGYSRMRSYVRWSFLYKGVQWRNIGRSSYRNEYGVEQESKKPRMVDNYIFEFIDHKVGQMSRLGTNIAAIPWNDEQSDVNNAKSCEKLLKSRYLDMDFDKIQDDADRIKFKYGTIFQLPLWDENIGPIHSSYERLNQIYKGKIPKDVLKKLKKDTPFRIGDVKVVNACPWEVFPELFKKNWENVDHFDYVPDEWLSATELKKRYPEHASKIKPNQRRYYDFDQSIISVPDDMVQIRHFFHRKTDHLPEGAHIIYTDDVILEWNPLPFNHGELPLVVDRDIEIEKELYGRPKITNIEQKQRQSNNIESAVARDLGMGSAPKWIWPKGAVTFKSANNGFSIMEYKGAKEPKLVQNNPVSTQAVAQLDRNENRMSKLMKVYEISRGNVPPGIEANAALRFLDEQEEQANESDKKKRKARVLCVSRKVISLMAQYYDASDGRTSRILGQNNDYLIEDLKNADFTKVYDVQFQNTSALPDTKSGKIATIIDMNMATQTDPVFKTPQIIKMLDLAQDETFVDRATASTNTANALFDNLLKGQPIQEPQMWDDLLIYYSVFYQRIQDYGFIKRTPDDIKEAIYLYIKTVEGLLWQKSQYNQKLMASLQQLDYYPAFFKPNVPNPSLTEPDYVGKRQEMDAGQMKNTREAIEESNQQQQP